MGRYDTLRVLGGRDTDTDDSLAQALIAQLLFFAIAAVTHTKTTRNSQKANNNNSNKRNPE